MLEYFKLKKEDKCGFRLNQFHYGTEIFGKA